MTEEPEAAPETRRFDVIALGLASLALVSFWRAVLAPGIWDDSYISITVARSLLEGEGLFFNPRLGDYAVTTLAWPLLIALGGLLTDDLPSVTRLLGFLSEFLLAFFFGLLALEVTRSRFCAVLALVFLISNPVVLLSSHWGMETALYLAMIAASMLCLVAGRPALCLALAAALVWTRLDGLAFYLLAGAAASTRLFTRLPTGRDLRRALPSILTVAAYFVFNVVYFGRLVPDSVTTKFAVDIPGAPLENAWLIAREFLRAVVGRSSFWMRHPTDYVYLVPLLALGFVALRRSGTRRRMAVPLLYAAGYAAGFVASTRIYATNFPWYFVPPLLAVFLLVVLGVQEVLRALARIAKVEPATSRSRFAAAAGVLVAVAWVGTVYPELRQDAEALQERAACRELVYGAGTVWAARHLRGTEERFLAANEIGAVGYFAPPGFGVIDLLGLARSRFHAPLSGHEALGEHRPAAIVTNVDSWPPSIEGALPGQYRWVRLEVSCIRSLQVGVRKDLMGQGSWSVEELESLVGVFRKDKVFRRGEVL